MSAPSELMERRRLMKNEGKAYSGELMGLTRNSTTKSEVEDKRAERAIPKRGEGMSTDNRLQINGNRRQTILLS
jgi:hypothetical protein